MKLVTKYVYVADDGREFSTESACADYESLCHDVSLIMTLLPEKPDLECNQYIQHNEPVFMLVRLRLLNLAKRYTDLRWVQESIDDPKIHSSWAGRAIDECGIPPLNSAWGRIMCTDKLFREWNQPYYANNTPQISNGC